MSNKKIDINRLHKLKSNLNNIDLINKDLEQKKINREQAKQTIIKKASSKFIDDGKPDPSVTQSIKPLSNVKVIRNNPDNLLQNQKVKDTQERLSYTLQMDPISKKQVDKYRARNDKNYLDNKFAHLNTRVMRIYLITIIGLLFLIAVSLIIIFNIKGE